MPQANQAFYFTISLVLFLRESVTRKITGITETLDKESKMDPSNKFAAFISWDSYEVIQVWGV